MARPPIELTPGHIEQICQAVRAGASLDLAASFAGISGRTMLRWRQQGEADQENGEEGTVFCQFCHALKKAQTECIIGNLAIISKAASNGVWQAAAWKLERLCPEVYGRRPRRAQSSAEGGAEEGAGQ